MTTYCVAVRKLEKKFDGLELHHIPRTQNQVADELAKLGSTQSQLPSGIFLEHLHTPSVKEDPFRDADPDMLLQIYQTKKTFLQWWTLRLM